jgi:hypothetical protein
VDRIKGHAAEANVAKVGEVDADVEANITVSNRSSADGSVTVTSTSTHSEGANKASYAVLAATQGDTGSDVRLSSITSGAYVLNLWATISTSFWVGVHGDAVKPGAARSAKQ